MRFIVGMSETGAPLHASRRDATSVADEHASFATHASLWRNDVPAPDSRYEHSVDAHSHAYMLNASQESSRASARTMRAPLSRPTHLAASAGFVKEHEAKWASEREAEHR